MSKELIKTDSFWYKIKLFFKKKFLTTKEIEVKEKINDTCLTDEQKKKMSKQLMQDEFLCFDLTDEEANEMLSYFNGQMKQIEAEIQRIESHINSMKKRK